MRKSRKTSKVGCKNQYILFSELEKWFDKLEDGIYYSRSYFNLGHLVDLECFLTESEEICIEISINAPLNFDDIADICISILYIKKSGGFQEVRDKLAGVFKELYNYFVAGHCLRISAWDLLDKDTQKALEYKKDKEK